MNTTEIGKFAENKVADYLRSEKHKIIVQNWRTRWCEIDIVSKTKFCVFFTEVKFRSSSEWGSGFDYINPAKLKQMSFAAEIWIADNKWTNEVQLMAAEVNADGKIEMINL